MLPRPLQVHAYDWPIVFVPIQTGFCVPPGGCQTHPPLEGAGIPLEAPVDIGRQLMAAAGVAAVNDIDALLAACRQGLRVDRTRVAEMRPGWIPAVMALPRSEVFAFEGRGPADRLPITSTRELPCAIMWVPPAPAAPACDCVLQWTTVDVRLYVDLTDLYYASLLVPTERGLVYTTQVGGVVCEQKEITGVLLPSGLTAEDSEAIIDMRIATGAEGIDADVADQLDRILMRGRHETIVVDRARMGASWEAWVFVVIDPNEERGPPLSAVLTWCNSD